MKFRGIEVVLALFVLLMTILRTTGQVTDIEDDSAFHGFDHFFQKVTEKFDEFTGHNRTRNPYKQRSTNGTDDAKFQEDLRAKQAEARRQRQIRERKREGLSAVKKTLRASQSEVCDWRTQPVSLLKGQLCGSHYKVLGLDRRKDTIDKNSLKKSFRKLSLLLHPDKNPAEESSTAFEVLQNSFDCLVDDKCKKQYDYQLEEAEHIISWNRKKIKEELWGSALNVLNTVHFYAIVTANHVYQLGLHVWNIVGEWKITVLEEEYSIGKPLVLLTLLWKGRILLQLHALSYIFLRVNYEIAKSRGQL